MSEEYGESCRFQLVNAAKDLLKVGRLTSEEEQLLTMVVDFFDWVRPAEDSAPF